MLKLKTLPKLVISDDGRIVDKWSKTKRVFRLSCICVGIVCITGVAIALNFQSQIENNKQSIYNELRDRSLKDETTPFSSAIAKIISSDGRIDERIAIAYTKWILESAAKHKVDPLMILAVMSIESRFDYSVISKGNALGLMQVIHSWHQEKTSRTALFDPKNNIDVGTQIIAEYSKRSSSDVEMLLRYNGSLGKGSLYAVNVLRKKNEYFNKVFSEITTRS